MGMESLSSATPMEIGFAITLFGAVLGGLRRIDSRFNALEAQMKEAMKGRMTTQQHQIWVLQMQVRNPSLTFPDTPNSNTDE